MWGQAAVNGTGNMPGIHVSGMRNDTPDRAFDLLRFFGGGAEMGINFPRQVIGPSRVEAPRYGGSSHGGGSHVRILFASSRECQGRMSEGRA